MLLLTKILSTVLSDINILQLFLLVHFGRNILRAMYKICCRITRCNWYLCCELYVPFWVSHLKMMKYLFPFICTHFLYFFYQIWNQLIELLIIISVVFRSFQISVVFKINFNWKFSINLFSFRTLKTIQKSTGTHVRKNRITINRHYQCERCNFNSRKINIDEIISVDAFASIDFQRLILVIRWKNQEADKQNTNSF